MLNLSQKLHISDLTYKIFLNFTLWNSVEILKVFLLCSFRAFICLRFCSQQIFMSTMLAISTKISISKILLQNLARKARSTIQMIVCLVISQLLRFFYQNLLKFSFQNSILMKFNFHLVSFNRPDLPTSIFFFAVRPFLFNFF